MLEDDGRQTHGDMDFYDSGKFEKSLNASSVSTIPKEEAINFT